MPRKAAECGTAGGYGAHRRRGSTPCRPCRRAWAEYQRTYAAGRGANLNPDEHGTAPAYRLGCRCTACKQAMTAWGRDQRDRLRGTLADNDPRHGTLNAYKLYACRCDPCRAAGARDWMRRRIDARARAEGVNRSEMIDIMLAYASAHMPRGWRPPHGKGNDLG